jgi:hypothetical protein
MSAPVVHTSAPSTPRLAHQRTSKDVYAPITARSTADKDECSPSPTVTSNSRTHADVDGAPAAPAAWPGPPPPHTSADDLPPDILARIAASGLTAADLAAASAVSKSWRCGVGRAVDALAPAGAAAVPPPCPLAALAARFPSLRALDLGRLPADQATDWAGLAGLPHLARLSLRGRRHAPGGTRLAAALRRLRALSHLDLSGCEALGEEVGSEEGECGGDAAGYGSSSPRRLRRSPSPVRRLGQPALPPLPPPTAPAQPALEPGGALRLAAALPPGLTSLVAARCPWIGDAELGAAAAACPRLAALVLDAASPALGRAGLGALAAAGARLTRLSLAGARGVDDAAVAALAAAPRLTDLTLDRCDAVTGACFGDGWGTWTGQAGAPTTAPLSSLSLRQCARLGDAGLAGLAASRLAASLTSLVLDECDGLTDAGLAALAGCASLASLSMRGLAGLGRSGEADGGCGLTRALASGRLTRLARLDAAGCVRLSPVAAAALAALPALADLDVSGCERVDAAFLRALSPAPSLATLRLAGCQGVICAGLEALLSISGGVTASLTSLDAGGCGGLGDGGVAALASRAPRLAHLGLAGCGRVGSPALAALAAGAPALATLNLAGCPGVTAEALALLAGRGADAGGSLARVVCWGTPAAAAAAAAAGGGADPPPAVEPASPPRIPAAAAATRRPGSATPPVATLRFTHLSSPQAQAAVV